LLESWGLCLQNTNAHFCAQKAGSFLCHDFMCFLRKALQKFQLLFTMTISFAGWEIYPRNLSFSALEADVSRRHKNLSRDAERLFVVDEEDIHLQVMVFNPTSEESL
jgi:hypothetical protein